MPQSTPKIATFVDRGVELQICKERANKVSDIIWQFGSYSTSVPGAHTEMAIKRTDIGVSMKDPCIELLDLITTAAAQASAEEVCRLPARLRYRQELLHEDPTSKARIQFVHESQGSYKLHNFGELFAGGSSSCKHM